MSTRVLLDEAGTADSSKSLQSEDSFINAFLKNASFSDASSSGDEGVIESHPEGKICRYSKVVHNESSKTEQSSIFNPFCFIKIEICQGAKVLFFILHHPLILYVE